MFSIGLLGLLGPEAGRLLGLRAQLPLNRKCIRKGISFGPTNVGYNKTKIELKGIGKRGELWANSFGLFCSKKKWKVMWKIRNKREGLGPALGQEKEK